MKAAAPLLALLGAATASADLTQPTQDRWAIGTSVRLQSSPYVGEGLRTDFLPELYYQGRAFYLDGTRAGWRTSAWDAVTLDAFAQYRFGGYNTELTSEIAGMRRYGTAEAGTSAKFATAAGQFLLEWRTDAFNRHGGQSLKGEWRGQWHSGNWRLEPYLFAEHESADVNNYYYGVEPDEALPDRPAYKPGAGTNLGLGTDAWYRAGAHLLGFSLSYTALDEVIESSPIKS